MARRYSVGVNGHLTLDPLHRIVANAGLTLDLLARSVGAKNKKVTEEIAKALVH